MTKFKFEIRETLSRFVEVSAEFLDEAWEEVERMYDDLEIVVNADDFGARLVETQAVSKARRDLR